MLLSMIPTDAMEHDPGRLLRRSEGLVPQVLDRRDETPTHAGATRKSRNSVKLEGAPLKQPS